MIGYRAKEIGNIGEGYAAEYLKKHRYRIVSRNYRKKYGEIDIIAENKNYLVFVEVKTRHTDSLTSGAQAVDLNKQRRIIKTASAYLNENDVDKYCRFDVCEIFVNSRTLKLEKLNYIENAFDTEAGYAGN